MPEYRNNDSNKRSYLHLKRHLPDIYGYGFHKHDNHMDGFRRSGRVVHIKKRPLPQPIICNTEYSMQFI